jgi:hypothetical protein
VADAVNRVRYTPDGRRRVTGVGGSPLSYGADALTYGADRLFHGTPGELASRIRIAAPRFIPDPDSGEVSRLAPIYSVDLCTGFVKVGEAEAFLFNAVVRFLATGEWQLTAPLSGVSCPDVDAVDSIIIWDETPTPRIVFAGIVRRVGGVEGARTRTITANDDSIEWVGVDLYGILAQRHAWPTPSTVVPWADAYDVRTGVGSTVAKEFIEANAGIAAHPHRLIPNLLVSDAGVGTSSTWSGRLQPLDQFVGRICREAGIGCSVTMPTIGTILFTLRALQDRSASLVLSDQGDLESLSRLVIPASATHVLGAGQGELAARTFVAAFTPATGLERVETVYENTNISVYEGLVTATETELALAGGDVSVDGAITDSAAQKIRYLDDYELGDWLGVEVDGVRYRSQVEAVTFTLSPERDSVRPVLGRAATNSLLSLVRDVAGISSRLDRQIA